jgi:hypothetical protein
VTVLDLGDPAGWPEPARAVVQAIAEEIAAWPEFHQFDNELTEDELAEEHAGFPACDLPSTRPDFTEDAERRLRGAAERYPEWLTEEETELLRRSGPLTWQGTTAGRVGLLWVVAPFAILTEEGQGFRPLLRSWGGESIGWTDNDEAAAVIARFTEASLPSVVELTVAVEEVPERKTLWSPAPPSSPPC